MSVCHCVDHLIVFSLEINVAFFSTSMCFAVCRILLWNIRLDKFTVFLFGTPVIVAYFVVSILPKFIFWKFMKPSMLWQLVFSFPLRQFPILMPFNSYSFTMHLFCFWVLSNLAVYSLVRYRVLYQYYWSQPKFLAFFVSPWKRYTVWSCVGVSQCNVMMESDMSWLVSANRSEGSWLHVYQDT